MSEPIEPIERHGNFEDMPLEDFLEQRFKERETRARETPWYSLAEVLVVPTKYKRSNVFKRLVCALLIANGVLMFTETELTKPAPPARPAPEILIDEGVENLDRHVRDIQIHIMEHETNLLTDIRDLPVEYGEDDDVDVLDAVYSTARAFSESYGNKAFFELRMKYTSFALQTSFALNTASAEGTRSCDNVITIHQKQTSNCSLISVLQMLKVTLYEVGVPFPEDICDIFEIAGTHEFDGCPRLNARIWELLNALRKLQDSRAVPQAGVLMRRPLTSAMRRGGTTSKKIFAKLVEYALSMSYKNVLKVLRGTVRNRASFVTQPGQFLFAMLMYLHEFDPDWWGGGELGEPPIRFVTEVSGMAEALRIAKYFAEGLMGRTVPYWPNGVLELDCSNGVRYGEYILSTIDVKDVQTIISMICNTLMEGGRVRVPGGTLTLVGTEESSRNGHAMSWMTCAEGILFMNSWGVRSSCHSLSDFAEQHNYDQVSSIVFLLVIT